MSDKPFGVPLSSPTNHPVIIGVMPNRPYVSKAPSRKAGEVADCCFHSVVSQFEIRR